MPTRRGVDGVQFSTSEIGVIAAAAEKSLGCCDIISSNNLDPCYLRDDFNELIDAYHLVAADVREIGLHQTFISRNAVVNIGKAAPLLLHESNDAPQSGYLLSPLIGDDDGGNRARIEAVY
jgi:hypothetical protein